ncbi:MAG: hypothetical protein SPD56_04545, partial [Alloprevotella sp.]|nr:hypothetical protein [Alloprevotella sp.]
MARNLGSKSASAIQHSQCSKKAFEVTKKLVFCSLCLLSATYTVVFGAENHKIKARWLENFDSIRTISER